jgi:hypothetical protein
MLETTSNELEEPKPEKATTGQQTLVWGGIQLDAVKYMQKKDRYRMQTQIYTLHSEPSVWSIDKCNQTSYECTRCVLQSMQGVKQPDHLNR